MSNVAFRHGPTVSDNVFRYARTWLLGVFPASAVVAASLYIFNLAALPDPSTADKDGLLRWLVLTELSERDVAVQRIVLDRLQTEFADDSEPLSVEESGLSDSLQARLERNLAHLQELWFYERCEQVCRLAAEKRPDFLDAQIRFAERWGELTPSDSGPDVFDMIDDWIAAAEGEKKAIAQDGVRWALHRFLQTRSLADYPQEMRLELANRIVEDLEDGAQLEGFATSEPVSENEDDFLKPNGMLLIKAWLTDQAQQYAKLDAQSQNEYLARRLKQIEQWNVVSMFAGPEEANRLNALIQFSSTTQKWIREASDEERPAMKKLFRDIAQRLMFGPS